MSAKVCCGSLAASDLKFDFVGLPDKLDVWPSNRLWIPRDIHPIPLNPTDLGAYWTPFLARLISLFLVLFSLIFTASKA